MRTDRPFDELRPIHFQRGFPSAAAGSVLASAGTVPSGRSTGTVVLCTASIVEELPRWMPKDSTSGWVTAEYRMHPGSTDPRSSRGDRPDGRATEIQRLIGRSLRSVIDMEKLGPRSIYVDCDVLRADGGTRTLCITAGYVALADALYKLALPESPLTDSVAAVSVGIVEQQILLDMCYAEDFAASVDMNLVMTGSGRFIEIQGTGEEATFSEEELAQLLAVGKKGIKRLTELQREVLSQ